MTQLKSASAERVCARVCVCVCVCVEFFFEVGPLLWGVGHLGGAIKVWWRAGGALPIFWFARRT
jgi:hypothetical protein